jgi:glucosylceramidase
MLPAQAATAAPERGGQPSAARVWVTTPDGSLRLSPRGSVPFTRATPSALTITVDPSRTFQTMTGFGASITDSSASVLYRLGPAQRSQVMADLFDPVTGDGLSYLRQPIGASDFVTDHAYTYDDVPAGATDFSLSHFSIAHDEAQILPLLRQARRLNPRLTVVATPWSPPAWMKTNDSLIGGRLIDDPRIYLAYARYLVAFVQAYARAGVPVDQLTVQNEPQNRAPSGYPGTDLSVAQEKKVIEVLGPLLRNVHLNTKILGYDHNWTEHPNDVANTPPDEAGDLHYPDQLLADPAAARWISGIAYHCYYGDPSAQTALHNEYPHTDIYFTECSGSHGPTDTPAQTFDGTLKWHARNLVLGVTRNWGKTVVNWNLALDQDGGPHVGGCSGCTGVLTIGPGNQVTHDAEYYTLGHLSRFVRPGAVRIASTSFGTTGWNGQVMDVAFRNPDGSTALVVHNENDDPRTFAVSENGSSFTYTLPGGALATFVWRSAGPTAARQLDPAQWTVTANPADPTDPCCAGDVAAQAVDDDASTRWSTGAAQAPGQYLELDLAQRTPVRQLVLDTGASTGDFPRGYRVLASVDGRTWRTAASGTGSGQLTAVPLAGAPVRYLRVELTTQSDSWWSVADVRAYR